MLTPHNQAFVPTQQHLCSTGAMPVRRLNSMHSQTLQPVRQASLCKQSSSCTHHRRWLGKDQMSLKPVNYQAFLCTSADLCQACIQSSQAACHSSWGMQTCRWGHTISQGLKQLCLLVAKEVLSPPHQQLLLANIHDHSAAMQHQQLMQFACLTSTEQPSCCCCDHETNFKHLVSMWTG